MKPIIFAFILTFLSACVACAQNSSLYNLQLASLDHGIISMTSYQNKKILVVEFDASNPDRNQLSVLNQVYKTNSDRVIVIGVPVNDFGTEISSPALKKLLRDTLKINFPVTETGRGKKGNNQNQLFKWLTSKNLNNHFDNDVAAPSEIFFINEHGILYATVRRKTYQAENSINQILNLPVNE